MARVDQLIFFTNDIRQILRNVFFNCDYMNIKEGVLNSLRN